MSEAWGKQAILSGGLLGEDTHAEEATPPAECLHKVRLAAAADGQNPGGHRVLLSSVASASL